MDSGKTHPTSLHEHINILALQAGKLRDELQKNKPRDLPVNALDNLNNLAVH